jgi:predicted aldo/keto reductase-like oxidoreductase
MSEDVPITDELRYLAYNEFAGDFHQAHENYLLLPTEIRAVRCSDCSVCAIHCPNGVEVRNRLIGAQSILA